jgi:hypothetical protein
MQWPARRSQGCEVARVLNLLDTNRNPECPSIRLLITNVVGFFRPFSIFFSAAPVTFRLFSASYLRTWIRTLAASFPTANFRGFYGTA